MQNSIVKHSWNGNAPKGKTAHRLVAVWFRNSDIGLIRQSAMAWDTGGSIFLPRAVRETGFHEMST